MRCVMLTLVLHKQSLHNSKLQFVIKVKARLLRLWKSFLLNPLTLPRVSVVWRTILLTSVVKPVLTSGTNDNNYFNRFISSNNRLDLRIVNNSIKKQSFFTHAMVFCLLYHTFLKLYKFSMTFTSESGPIVDIYNYNIANYHNRDKLNQIYP